MLEENTNLKHLFNEHINEVYRAVYFLCRDDKLTEKIVEETFVQAFKEIQEQHLKDISKIHLLHIASDITKRYVKKGENTLSSQIKKFHLNEGSLYADEYEGCIRRILTKIDPLSKNIFLCYYYNQLSYTQIAEKFEMNVEVVKYKIEDLDDMLHQQLLEYIEIKTN